MNNYHTYADAPDEQLRLASKNFWCAQTGREYPPAPSIRIVGGKQTLGRYMGPFECLLLMQERKQMWQKWYTWFLLSVGGTALFGEVDFVFIFAFLPLMAVWYLLVKRHHRKLYDGYYKTMQEIIANEEAQWVPYDKSRLKLISEEPRAIWP